MWLLFHRSGKSRPVSGGHSFVETCPECRQRATFREVEISEGFGLFFIDLVSDKETAYRCGNCGETFDLKDQPSAPVTPVRSAAARERQRAAEQEQRQQLAEDKAARIEDELAELKKRLGR
ncbi:MAG: hypothetical protein AB7O24_23895 [Kofleriaceae bacterium]